MKRIKKRYLLFACFLLSFQFCFLSQAQKVRSVKSSIYLNTVKAEETIIADTIPPLIKLISPQYNPKEKFKCNLPEITLIGKITDNQSGISRTFINSEVCKITEDGLFVQKIPLKKGNNTIDIIAIDTAENYSEIKLIIEHIIETQSITKPLNIEGKFYALLVGVDKYEDANLMDLDNPVRDAENLYNILSSAYCFDKENIILIKNARRADITDALDILAEKLTKDDNLLIFYAGHGWWGEAANVGSWWA